MKGPIIANDLDAILENKSKYDFILDYVKGGVAIWDNRLNCLYLSPRLRDILGVPTESLSPDFGVDGLADPLKNISEVAQIVRRTYITDHGFCYINTSLQQVINNEGVCLGYLSVCQDVTDFHNGKADEEIKRQQFKMRSKLEKMNLNQKQIQIIEMLTRGETNKGIAIAVNLSEQGVKYHIGNLLERFGSRNRLELRTKIYELIKTG